MKNYSKLFKILMLVLIIISVAVLVAGSVIGFESKGGAPVDWLLYWGYAMIALALISVIVVGAIISFGNNPKSIVKAGIILLAIAAICFVVYLISSGSPALGLLEQPDHATLKLTDTILNLTYITGACAIFSIVVGEIIASVRNRKAQK